MGLWTKAMQIFGFHPRRDLTDIALERSREVGAKADRVNAVLSSYLDAQDPFTAFATDIYERGQENRIHRGTSH